MDIIHKGNPVSLGVLALLGIMSVGSWYIFFVKYLEQSRILGQARSVERRFWSSGTLNEGIDKLPKNSMFRLIAESGVRASQGGTSRPDQNAIPGASVRMKSSLPDTCRIKCGRRKPRTPGRRASNI